MGDKKTVFLNESSGENTKIAPVKKDDLTRDVKADCHAVLDTENTHFSDKRGSNKHGDIIKRRIIENQKRIDEIDRAIHITTEKRDIYRREILDEYRSLCINQLSLLTEGVFMLLDHRFLPSYLAFISKIGEDDDGRELLRDFFDMHDFPHVSSGTSDEQYDGNFGNLFRNHLRFLISHYMDIGTNDYAKIKKIIDQYGLSEENGDFLSELDFVVRSFQESVDILSPSIRREFFHIQQYTEKIMGESYLRNTAYNISVEKWDDSILKGNIYPFLSAFSFACIYSHNDIVERACALLSDMDLDIGQLRYAGVLLQEKWYYAEALRILLLRCDLKSPEVLEAIVRIGILRPELVAEIQSGFAYRIDSMGFEVCSFSAFVSRMEEEIASWKRNDIPLQKAWQISGLGHWMEGRENTYFSCGKEGECMDRAGECYFMAYEKLRKSMDLAKQQYIQLENSGGIEDHEVIREKYMEILRDYGYFITYHSLRQTEAQDIFDLLFREFDDENHLKVLFDAAMMLWDRKKAHAHLTRMDVKMQDTRELWMEYFISDDSTDSKMRAVQLLLDTDIWSAGLIGADIVREIQSFAYELFQSYERDIPKDPRGVENYLFLFRSYVIDFEADIDKAIGYWKRVSEYLIEGDMEILDGFYAALMHPDHHIYNRSSYTEDIIVSNRLLSGFLIDAEQFYAKFADDPRLGELIQEIIALFRNFPEGLWLGFVRIWEQKYADMIVRQARDAYGPERVTETVYTLQ